MLLTGCSDSDAPTATPSAEPVFVVSGHVRDPHGSLAGSDARVVGIWIADAGEGDYAYVFGSGEIDLQAGTFRMEFVEEPPSEASLRKELQAWAVGWQVGLTACHWRRTSKTRTALAAATLRLFL